MLLNISIKNFILLNELNIEFERGLTVITGETGAGKSILLDALLFCLGGKFSTNIIKNGKDFCSVTASFSLPQNIENFLEEIGIESTEELIIKRTLSTSSKKKFLINDQPVTQKTVEELGKYLFEIHAQTSLTTLTDPKTHLEILDSFAEVEDIKISLVQLVKKWHELKKEINAIHQEQASCENEIDYLTHAIEEITKAQIMPGEEKELADIKNKLQKKEKEIKIFEDILFPLEMDQIDQAFGKASRVINRITGEDAEEFNQISQLIEYAYSNIEQVRIILKNKLREIMATDYNLDEIEERLYIVRTLAKKYKVSADEMDAFLESMSTKLIHLQTRIGSAALLEQEFIKTQEEYIAIAEELTEMRKAAASILEKKIQAELAVLKMEKALFEITILQKDKETLIPNINGNDKINFVASTNPGMPLAPIDKIASGGELSRIMLALKVALFDKGQKATSLLSKRASGRELLGATETEDRNVLNVAQDLSTSAAKQVPVGKEMFGKLASGRDMLEAPETEDLSVLLVREDLSTGATPQIPPEVEFLKKATIIFDEIDTGIGGAVADSVGEKLKYLGQACQVIVITHQPQVACKADNHILVTKRQLSDVTDLEVKILSFAERQQELARMLSGKTITESSLKAAMDLLS